MSNRRKSQREREQRQQERGGYCASGIPHDWAEKSGYGVVCTRCGAKKVTR